MTSEDIDRSMWALELRGVGSLSLVRRPVPAPASGEDLLRITAVGICGSDLHWLDEAGIGDARLTRPRTRVCGRGRVGRLQGTTGRRRSGGALREV
jgi:threonine dehydrogenase-like Zn-dependent dehydrogenase